MFKMSDKLQHTITCIKVAFHDELFLLECQQFVEGEAREIIPRLTLAEMDGWISEKEVFGMTIVTTAINPNVSMFRQALVQLNEDTEFKLAGKQDDSFIWSWAQEEASKLAAVWQHLSRALKRPNSPRCPSVRKMQAAYRSDSGDLEELPEFPLSIEEFGMDEFGMDEQEEDFNFDEFGMDAQEEEDDNPEKEEAEENTEPASPGSATPSCKEEVEEEEDEVDPAAQTSSAQGPEKIYVDSSCDEASPPAPPVKSGSAASCGNSEGSFGDHAPAALLESCVAECIAKIASDHVFDHHAAKGEVVKCKRGKRAMNNLQTAAKLLKGATTEQAGKLGIQVTAIAKRPAMASTVNRQKKDDNTKRPAKVKAKAVAKAEEPNELPGEGPTVEDPTIQACFIEWLAMSPDGEPPIADKLRIKKWKECRLNRKIRIVSFVDGTTVVMVMTVRKYGGKLRCLELLDVFMFLYKTLHAINRKPIEGRA